MAGDWIKIENATPDKPEIFEIAEHLGLDPDAVVGKLLRVWIWADEQLRSCHAPSVTKTVLDRVTGVTDFYEALKKVGWLREENRLFVFENFDRHNGNTAKTRALAQKRQSRRRHADVTLGALPEKRREENKETKEKKVVFHELFEEFWNTYPARHGKRVGKQKAYEKWKKIPDKGGALVAAQNYSAAAAADQTIPKDAFRFLSDGYWQDWLSPAAAPLPAGPRLPTPDEEASWRP